MKIENLSSIQTEQNHNGTVSLKRLIEQGEEAGRVATLNYAWLESGMSLDPHVHEDGNEYYLFLEGEGQMKIGNETGAVKEDDFVFVPAKQEHSVVNNSKAVLRFITLRTY